MQQFRGDIMRRAIRAAVRGRLIRGLAASLLGLIFSSSAAAASVIEFYNTTLDNYFITADPIEAAAIDSGSAGPGWISPGGFDAGGGHPR